MGENRNILLREWEMSKPAAYLILAISIISEQIGTVCLEASQGYSVLSFSVLTVILYAFTYYTFCKILNIINLAVAYATWTAVGSIGASLFGVWIFHQPMSPAGWASIGGMTVGVFLLNCFGTPQEPDAKAGAADSEDSVDDGAEYTAAAVEDGVRAGVADSEELRRPDATREVKP